VRFDTWEDSTELMCVLARARVCVCVCVCVREREREGDREDIELMVTGGQSKPVAYGRDRYENSSNINHII